MTVLITGAGGFVGRALVERLSADGRHRVRAATRGGAAGDLQGHEAVTVGAIRADTDWTAALRGVDLVVHLAARVHQMRDDSADPEAAYREVNTEGTLNLARQCVAAGVRRLVFLSSVKVNGDGGHFTERDEPAPIDPYGRSKLLAERGLLDLAERSGLEVVIVRPPLVYGPGVKANFRALVGAVRRGFPLPLARVANRRSLVGLDNLCDFIVRCLEHPAAANEVFFVSDGRDLSTPELIRSVAKALGRRANLVPVPVTLLRMGAAVLGKQAALDRLAGSLTVSTEKAKRLLDWRAPYSVEQQLERTVRRESSSGA